MDMPNGDSILLLFVSHSQCLVVEPIITIFQPVLAKIGDEIILGM